MIELAKSGRLKQENSFILYKDTKMQFIQWRLTFHTGTYLVIRSDKVATGSFDKTAKLWDV